MDKKIPSKRDFSEGIKQIKIYLLILVAKSAMYSELFFKFKPLLIVTSPNQTYWSEATWPQYEPYLLTTSLETFHEVPAGSV